jgi:hypothetical protein
MEHFNELFRDYDKLLRYYIERGLPDWDATETYQAGDIVRYGGVFYRAVAPVVGTNPAANEFLSTRTWERWLYSPFGSDRTATDDSPIVTWRNARSYPGNKIDRLGFIAGANVQNVHETWMGAETLTATGTADFVNTDRRWFGDVTLGGAGGGISIGNPNATQRARYLDISIGTGAADSALFYFKEAPSIFDADVDAMVEANVWTGANVDLMRPIFGLLGAGVDPWGTAATFAGAILYKKNASANWFCRTGDGTTLGAETDTGIAVPTNGFTQLRAEWIGANKDMPVAGAASRARFYVNGARFEATANLPSLPATPYMRPVIGVKRDTGAAARGIFVMPLRFAARF